MKPLSLFLVLSFGAVASSHAALLDLRNESNTSLPLEIPGVMNPNLSPNSNSRVALERGQKIFFRHKGKKTLLLEITDEQDGQVLVVDAIMAARIRALEHP